MGRYERPCNSIMAPTGGTTFLLDNGIAVLLQSRLLLP